jgi:hypothetical protein
MFLHFLTVCPKCPKLLLSDIIEITVKKLMKRLLVMLKKDTFFSYTFVSA